MKSAHFGVQEGRVGPQNGSKSDPWEVRKAPKSSPEVQKSSLKVQNSSLEIQSRKPVQSRIRNTADLKPESAKEEDPTGKGETAKVKVYYVLGQTCQGRAELAT